MSVDDRLADLVRAALARQEVAKISEVRMFGGIGFMMDGNLLVGASSRGLLIRVGPEAEGAALARPSTRPMVMRGRRMPGYVYADPPGLTASAVATWVELAVQFVRTLPPKTSRSKKPKPRRADS